MNNSDDLIIDTSDEAKKEALAALNATDDENEQEYLEAVLTVIDYYRDETFDDQAYRMFGHYRDGDTPETPEKQIGEDSTDEDLEAELADLEGDTDE